MNHNVKIKIYLFKRKEVDIPKSNTPLNFNDKTSNLIRVAAKKHHSKILVVEPVGYK
jgi:hypothetical protein